MFIPSIKSQLIQELQRAFVQSQRSIAMTAPLPVQTFLPADARVLTQSEEVILEPYMDAAHSPINIKISCPIDISGNGNLVAIDPAEMASDMAKCMAESMKDCTMARAGIPMIDEEGRPRPLDVQVNAGIRVHGDKNVIGKKAMRFGLQATLNLKRHRAQTEDKEERPKAEGNEEDDKGADVGQKRQRVS